jgi:glycosyltransferase involved in cell wall biosynthesis
MPRHEYTRSPGSAEEPLFSLYSGYGNDGFSLLRALHRWGADVYPQPVWLDVPIPSDLLPLFGRQLQGPFDLTINHWDPAHLHITRQAREMTSLAVAWSMWEMAPAPRHPESGLRPHCEGRSKIRENLKWFDAFLGYSDVTMQAMEPYLPPAVRRGVLQGGFEASDWKPVERDWSAEAPFRFGMHGALNARKAPFLVLQAFLELAAEHEEFRTGARLLLHTTTPGVFPEMNEIYAQAGLGVRVFLEAWDKPKLEEFYAACHALVYPSHGEGKNLPALEHAATGGAEIVTDWAGHQGWLGADYAYPLACEVKPMNPARPDLAHWAVVDIAEVKRVMWHVFTHRGEAKAKGELASRLIPQMCSWDVVVESLFRRLRDLVPVQGAAIYNLATACRRDRSEERVPDGPGRD